MMTKGAIFVGENGGLLFIDFPIFQLILDLS